jgi:predicted nucleic acid-binding protein
VALADTNFWVALAFSGHGHHGAAGAWLAKLKPAAPVVCCRATQQSFLRLVTTAAVCRPLGVAPLGNRDAWAVFEGFLAAARVAWADEAPGWRRNGSGCRRAPRRHPSCRWTRTSPPSR